MLLDKDMKSIAPELRLEMKEIEMAQKLKAKLRCNKDSVGAAASATEAAVDLVDSAMMAAAEDGGFDATMMAIMA